MQNNPYTINQLPGYPFILYLAFWCQRRSKIHPPKPQTGISDTDLGRTQVPTYHRQILASQTSERKADPWSLWLASASDPTTWSRLTEPRWQTDCTSSPRTQARVLPSPPKRSTLEELCGSCDCESWEWPGPRLQCWDQPHAGTCPSKLPRRGTSGTGWQRWRWSRSCSCPAQSWLSVGTRNFPKNRWLVFQCHWVIRSEIT